MKHRLLALLASPGAKRPIEGAAPTQRVPAGGKTDGGGDEDNDAAAGNVTGYAEKAKARALDRWLDRVVRASGSEPVFVATVAGLLAWAFLGIPYGGSADWAVAISDAQAIVSYVFDSLLMRQQLNEYERLVRVAASLRSRAASNRRMLRSALLLLPAGAGAGGKGGAAAGEPPGAAAAAPQQLRLGARPSGELPRETAVGRLSTAAARAVGHVGAVGLYWACIAVWLGFGPACGWSDQWQLYINSATSALMVFVFAFLANVQERHGAHVERCLQAIFERDSAVERALRAVTGDVVSNETVVVAAPEMSRVQRAIFYYADLVGTLTGIAILAAVMVLWLAIGPLMAFSSNWWLLIGTYAGLVGLNDSFVLRNVQMLLDRYARDAFEQVDLDDGHILDHLGLPDLEPAAPVRARSISHRLSAKMGVVCAHEATVVVGFVFIVGLLAGASAMRWSTTGQLLCNIPPSIIETFFMMILITGHNLAEAKRYEDLEKFYLRRSMLLSYVHGLESEGNAKGHLEVSVRAQEVNVAQA